MRIAFPDYMTLENWAGALKTDVPKGNVPNLNAFPSWQAWGKYICGLPYFATYRIPSPNDKETWQQWAHKLIQKVFV